MSVAILTQKDFENLAPRMEALPGENQLQKVLRIHKEFPGKLIASYMLYKMTGGRYGSDDLCSIPGLPEDLKTAGPREYIPRSEAQMEYMRRAAGEKE